MTPLTWPGALREARSGNPVERPARDDCTVIAEVVSVGRLRSSPARGFTANRIDLFLKEVRSVSSDPAHRIRATSAWEFLAQA